MNRLNPLYVILLTFTLVVISFVLLNKEISNYNANVKEFNNLQVKAKEYKEFKSNWDNKKYALKTLNQILKNRIFKNQKVLKVNTKNSIKIKMISDNPKILNSFLNKILNKKLIINKLEVNKNYIDLVIGVR